MTIHGTLTLLSYERGMKRSTIHDAVCGSAIEDPTEYMTLHEGAAYYFCSASCREKFERNPTHYVRPMGGGANGATRNVA